MRIGVAGPIDVGMLRDLFPPGADIPNAGDFPLAGHLARELYNRGNEIVLFSLSNQIATTRRIDGDRISAYICPRRRPRWEMMDFFRAERHALRDAMRAAGCDVIHAHWTYEYGSAAAESGLPHVVTAHDVPMAVLRYARHPYWLEKPWLAVTVLRKAQCVTAVSPYVARRLERFLRPQRDIVVIPNGVPSQMFELARCRTQRSPEKVMFASVLNWGPLKNAKALIRAFAVTRQALSQRVELQMFGSGFEKGGPAEQWAKRHHADAGIRFSGVRPHSEILRSLASDVDILVHPSLEEACCMAVIEAMAIGVPVIGGKDSGGIPWQLDAGKAGLLVDVQSPASIARGMQMLVENRGLRQELALLGHKKALRDYRLDKVTTPYENVLAKAVQEQGH